jgi:hypothetical protein
VENEIISYIEMCQREGMSLQKGMNFGLRRNHSVILMSLRPNAPYQDRLDEDGTTLIYEGHDAARNKSTPQPKHIDQPEITPAGTLTENGRFHKAAQDHKKGLRPPERVRVYEKLHVASGHTTGYSILLTRGLNMMVHATYLNSSL